MDREVTNGGEEPPYHPDKTPLMVIPEVDELGNGSCNANDSGTEPLELSPQFPVESSNLRPPTEIEAKASVGLMDAIMNEHCDLIFPLMVSCFIKAQLYH